MVTASGTGARGDWRPAIVAPRFTPGRFTFDGAHKIGISGRSPRRPAVETADRQPEAALPVEIALLIGEDKWLPAIDAGQGLLGWERFDGAQRLSTPWVIGVGISTPLEIFHNVLTKITHRGFVPFRLI
jgi:hypothetical protein